MHIAYIHPSYPGSEGSGATHSATQIVRGLCERGHDVTVFCPSDVPDEVRGDTDRIVDLEIDPGFPRHFGEELNRAIRERSDQLAGFDVVHSYLMQALPAIGRLGRKTGVETALTLNAYLAICPKNDLRYMGREQCGSNGRFKCTACLTDDIRRKAPRYEEPAYEKVARVPHRWTNSLRRLRLVSRGLEYRDDVSAYRAPSAHVKGHHTDLGSTVNAST